MPPPMYLLFPYTPLFRSDRKSGSAGMPSRSSDLTIPLTLSNLKLLRSEERFSRNAETDIVCRLLLEKKKKVRIVLRTASNNFARSSDTPRRSVRSHNAHV